MHASDRYLADGATLDDLRQADGTIGYFDKLRHGVTGKGLNDFDAIFRILAEHDYRGWVSIEDGMNGMEEMAESLAFLRRKTAKYFPRYRRDVRSRVIGVLGTCARRAGRSATLHAGERCASLPEAEFVARVRRIPRDRRRPRSPRSTV